MELVAAVIVLILFEYFVFGAFVGRYRTPDKVPAPRMTGDPKFERTLRAQLNTAERLVIVIPAMWIFGHYVSPLWGAVLGFVWFLSRIHYFWGYVQDAEKRTPGVIAGALVEVVLLLGSAFGVVRVVL